MTDQRWPCAALLLLSILGENAAGNEVICPVAGSFDTSVVTDTFDPVIRFSELSGLALSETQVSDLGNPVLFGMSDIGGGDRLGIWDSGTGDRLISLQIPEPNNDWESMAYGSCGNSAGTCLYIADTGDNLARTSEGLQTQRSQAYRILKIKEPDWKFYGDGDMVPAADIEVLEFNYLHPSSPTAVADSEAMFMDHTGWGEGKSVGDLYIITKWDNRNRLTLPRVFHVPVSAWNTLGNTYSPEAIGNGSVLLGSRWTRADMKFDGTLIAVGDVNSTSLYTRCPGVSVEEALIGAEACYSWDNPVSGQMETFTWSIDGSRNLQIAEGTKQPMAWSNMVYDPANAVSCPDNGSFFVTRAPTTPVPTSSPSVVLPVVNETDSMAPTQSPSVVPVVPTNETDSMAPSQTPTGSPSTASPSAAPIATAAPPTVSPSRENDTDPKLGEIPSSGPTFSLAPSASGTPVAGGDASPSLRPVVAGEPESETSQPTAVTSASSRPSLAAFGATSALMLLSTVFCR